MAFEATSQDSRNPNSPQWGYVKVKDPENQLFYPAKDKHWNEYVMFVHETENDIRNLSDPEKTMCGNVIQRRTDLKCIMVPATLTIDCSQLANQLKQFEENCQEKLSNCGTDPEETALYQSYLDNLAKYRASLEQAEIPTQPISIPSEDKTGSANSNLNQPVFIPDETTVWVALVIGSK